MRYSFTSFPSSVVIHLKVVQTVKMSSVPRARRVYSVCGHWQEDECPTTEVNKPGTLSRLLNRFSRRELPTRTETIYLLGFCKLCRTEYNVEGSILDLQTVILNYWAVKNWLGLSDPVPASRVPTSIVFAEPSSRFQHVTNRRLEIAMLANQLACAPFSGSLGDLYRRLELVRERTLQWAAGSPSPSPSSPGRSHIFRPEPDAMIQPRQVHEATLSILSGGPTQNEQATIAPEDAKNTKVCHGDMEADLNNSPTQELVSRFSVSTISSTSSSQSTRNFSDDSDDSSNDEMAGRECIVIHYSPHIPQDDKFGPPAGNWI